MSKIEWTGETWNPIVGCSIVSPGCTNCYAMRTAARIERMSPTLEHCGGSIVCDILAVIMFVFWMMSKAVQSAGLHPMLTFDELHAWAQRETAPPAAGLPQASRREQPK